jgi:hypothetical protein
MRDSLIAMQTHPFANLIHTATRGIRFFVLVGILFISTYVHADITTGLVGYWPFDSDEGKPTVTDASGNNKTGTIKGSGTTFVPGAIGTAVSFNGSGWIDVPLGDLASMSVSLWIKTPSPSGTYRVFDRGTLSPLLRFTGGDLQFIAGLFFNTNKITFQADKWYHVVVTGDATGHKIYVNGVLNVSTPTPYPVFTNSAPLMIGANIDRFVGQMDDFRVYNRAVTDQEVTDLFNQGPVASTVPMTGIPSTPTPGTPTAPTQSPTPTNRLFEVKQDGKGNFATIQACLDAAQPGDTCLVYDGIYHENLSFKQSGLAGYPIQLKAQGKNAIIDGSKPITGWTKCASSQDCGGNSNWQNIYKVNIKLPSFLSADFAPISLNLFQGEKVLKAAQYPQSTMDGYQTQDNYYAVPAASMTPTSLTDPRLADLSQGKSLVGSIVYLWVNPNAIVPRNILTHDVLSNTITFESTQVYTNRDTLYAIANSFSNSIFKQEGQYYFDPIMNADGSYQLYVWPFANENLSISTNVTMSDLPGAINTGNKSHFVIDGFKIRKQTGDQYGEGGAIGGGNSSDPVADIVIRNNEIYGQYAQSFQSVYYLNVDNFIFENNYLHDTRGGNRGVLINGANILVRNNKLERVAGTGIYFPGAKNSAIINNTIKDDLAAHSNAITTYQGCDNVLVAGNVVINSNAAYTFENGKNFTVINNIFLGSGVACWGACDTALIANNIIEGPATLMNYVANGTIKNNIWLTRNAPITDVQNSLLVDGDFNGTMKAIDRTKVFANAPKAKAVVGIIYKMPTVNNVNYLYIAPHYSDVVKVGDVLRLQQDGIKRTVTGVAYGIFYGNWETKVAFDPPVNVLQEGLVEIWPQGTTNFEEDYHLKADGIAVNAGSDVSNYSTLSFFSKWYDSAKDISGNLRQGAWDIGPYEYAPTLNFYVNPAATGLNNGSDWANAFTMLPANLQRGAVYYVADGNYGSYTLASVTGTQYITVKKATIADHGTNTGWLDTYGDGVAVFSGLTISASYVVFDGATGGGPGKWNSGHGFEVTSTGAACSDKSLVSLSPGASFITLNHVHIHGGNNNYPINGIKGVGGNSNLNFSHNSLHTLFGPAYHIGTWNNVVIENSYLADVRSTGAIDAYCANWHAEGVSSIGTNTDLTIRHNLWDRIRGTAVFAGVNTGSSIRWKIYGNIISRSTTPIYYYYEPSPSTNQQTMSDLEFYNNVITNIAGVSQGGITIQSGTNNKVYNNIWYNNDANSFSINAVHDYNLFSNNLRKEGCSPACDKNAEAASGETHAQILTANPFRNVLTDADPLTSDFSLKAETNPGMVLPAPFNTDLTGAIRGADGVFDRGSYEYTIALGDVSGDGQVTMLDAALVLRYTMGAALSESQKQKADINSDGLINTADALAIARKALGL